MTDIRQASPLADFAPAPKRAQARTSSGQTAVFDLAASDRHVPDRRPVGRDLPATARPPERPGLRTADRSPAPWPALARPAARAANEDVQAGGADVKQAATAPETDPASIAEAGSETNTSGFTEAPVSEALKTAIDTSETAIAGQVVDSVSSLAIVDPVPAVAPEAAVGVPDQAAQAAAAAVTPAANVLLASAIVAIETPAVAPSAEVAVPGALAATVAATGPAAVSLVAAGHLDSKGAAKGAANAGEPSPAEAAPDPASGLGKTEGQGDSSGATATDAPAKDHAEGLRAQPGRAADAAAKPDAPAPAITFELPPGFSLHQAKAGHEAIKIGAPEEQPGHLPAGPESRPTPLSAVPLEIGLRAMAGSKRFDIRLDPAELGRVDVRLDIDDSGQVTAKLTVDRVETLHLLQRDARTLERAFEQAGLKPSDGGVDISLRDQSGQPGSGQDRQDGPGHRPRRTQSTLLIEPEIAEAQGLRRVLAPGRVDLSI